MGGTDNQGGQVDNLPTPLLIAFGFGGVKALKHLTILLRTSNRYPRGVRWSAASDSWQALLGQCDALLIGNVINSYELEDVLSHGGHLIRVSSEQPELNFGEDVRSESLVGLLNNIHTLAEKRGWI